MDQQRATSRNGLALLFWRCTQLAHSSRIASVATWLRGERHGLGKCTYPNGDCYIGDWRHGKRQGAGSLAHTASEGSYTRA